jgi:hypothetical protein
MDGSLQMIRALALVVLCAGALVACDRYIDLSPPPDAHHNDSANDSVPPDAASLLDGGGIGDAFVPPD